LQSRWYKLYRELSVWYFPLCIGCSGKRNRAEFVAIDDFEDGRLMSDYRFLEEASMLSESAARSRIRLSRSGGDVQQIRQIQHQVGCALGAAGELAGICGSHEGLDLLGCSVLSPFQAPLDM
jgi:hypothetical protein